MNLGNLAIRSVICRVRGCSPTCGGGSMFAIELIGSLSASSWGLFDNGNT